MWGLRAGQGVLFNERKDFVFPAHQPVPPVSMAILVEQFKAVFAECVICFPLWKRAPFSQCTLGALRNMGTPHVYK